MSDTWSLTTCLLVCTTVVACAAGSPTQPRGLAYEPENDLRTLQRKPSPNPSPTPRKPGPRSELAAHFPLPEGESWVGPGEIEIYAINTRQRERIVLYDESGHLTESGVARVNQLFACHRTSEEKPIARRLITILYLLGQAYERPIHLVSGYRHPRRGRQRSSSRHARARAADVRLPGVPVEDVAQWLEERFAKIGVGYYPRSEFVHLDVRSSSYYWVDHSGPGQRSRLKKRPILRAPDKGADWTLDSTDLPLPPRTSHTRR